MPKWTHAVRTHVQGSSVYLTVAHYCSELTSTFIASYLYPQKVLEHLPRLCSVPETARACGGFLCYMTQDGPSLMAKR